MSGTSLVTARERALAVLGGEPDDATLRRYLHGIAGVDAVGLEQRAAGLGTRSIKTTSKKWALDTIISLIDLTTLEGADTPGKVRSLVAKAMTPDPADATTPRVAAVCVYGDMVPYAVDALGAAHGDPDDGLISVAAVATAFPSGRSSLEIKLADTAEAVAAGADEIDMVIDRGAFLAGRYGLVFDQIAAVKEACRRPDGTSASLKVILETGELVTYDNVRRASWLSILAGGDFIKTSTGKVLPGRDPAGHTPHARGRARLAPRDGPAHRGEARGRHPCLEGRDQVPRHGGRDRRARSGSSPTSSASAHRAS